jgi:hypothetical protein
VCISSAFLSYWLIRVSFSGFGFNRKGERTQEGFLAKAELQI